MSDRAESSADDALDALAERTRVRAERDEEAKAARRQADVDDTRRMVVAELRGSAEDDDRKLADKLEAGDAAMTDREQAVVDSIVMGHGFLVDGVRVSPLRVTIFRWDGP